MPRPFLPSMTTATIAIASVLLALTSMGVATSTTHAQTPVPLPTVTPGSIVWTFGPEPPVVDDRVAMALDTLMTPRIAAAWPVGPTIVRVRQEAGAFPPAFVAPPTDVQKLLDASGYGQHPPFVELGTCKVWVSPDAAPGSSSVPSKVPSIVAGALHDALASLGVQTQPCTVTTDPSQAHVLLWMAGGSPPPLAMRQGTGTFLGSTTAPATPGVPGVPAGASRPASRSRPAITGTGGVPRNLEDSRIPVVAMMLMGALLAGGRTLTRRRAARCA